MTTISRRIWNRVYGDFLAPSGLGAYRAILERALRAGYETVTVERFWQLVGSGSVDPARRYLILRHDIDTDPQTGAQMWEIDRSLAVASSYYFRLSTVDYGLMAAIAEGGGEASYHFEELATVAKIHGLRDRGSVLALIPEAQERFVRNLGILRRTTGLGMRVVSSHGDFANRYLRLPNWAILLDQRVRRIADIDLEVYDEAFLSHVSHGYSDTQYPRNWTPDDVESSLQAPVPVLYVLVHPRNWQTRPLDNALDDMRRFRAGVRFRLAPAVRAPALPSEALLTGSSPPSTGDASGSDAARPLTVTAAPERSGADRPILLVRAPATFPDERRYVLDLVLAEWLGMDYRLLPGDDSTVRISLQGDQHDAVLGLPDILFATPESDWLTERSMPPTPLARLSVDIDPPGITDEPGARFADASAIPVLFADEAADGRMFRRSSDGIAFAADIFGSVFYMLSRYEEVARPVRDEHARFPSYASLAGIEGFLGRPVVDEYVNALWVAMRELWPTLTRPMPQFRLRLTHDVDTPWAALGHPSSEVAHSLAGDVIRRRDIDLAWRRARSYVKAQVGRLDGDPYDTFDLLMEMSERHGLRSTFYFLAGNTAGSVDGRYQLSDPPIRRLLRRIHDRGHEVGLHSSYGTFKSATAVQAEFTALVAGCAGAGFEQATWGARQHYLRFETPTTWRHLADAGLAHDSTLGFADQPGFRAGTGREYPTYDLIERRPLRLRERPLLVMDATLFGYLGMDTDAAARRAMAVVDMCRHVGSDAVVCYHNSSLASRRRRAHYRTLVDDLNHRAQPSGRSTREPVSR